MISRFVYSSVQNSESKIMEENKKKILAALNQTLKEFDDSQVKPSVAMNSKPYREYFAREVIDVSKIFTEPTEQRRYFTVKMKFLFTDKEKEKGQYWETADIAEDWQIFDEGMDETLFKGFPENI